MGTELADRGLADGRLAGIGPASRGLANRRLAGRGLATGSLPIGDWLVEDLPLGACQ